MKYRKNMVANINARKIMLFSGDVAVLFLSLLGALFLGFWGEFTWKIFNFHLLPFSIIYVFWLAIFYVFGLYDLKVAKPGSSFYTKTLGALTACLGLGTAFFYLFPFFDITPKTNLFLNVAIFGALFLLWRKIFHSLFSKYLLSKAAIVGENPETRELVKEIINKPQLGYRLEELDLEKDLLSQINEKKIDTLIMATNLDSDPKMAEKLYECLPARLNFIDWASAYETIYEKIPVSFIGRAWFFDNLREGSKNSYDRIKRAADLVLASALLVLTLPLWLLIFLGIKVQDRGPILYKQKRIGKDRRPFTLYKFRSMKKGAEDQTGPVWSSEEDARVTRAGKVLRRLHLDELPQMINVLKGEISLAGPRPERPEFVEQLEKEIPHYHIRHIIRPGFSGWAQIKFRYGRSVMDSQEKFQYDLYYLKNRNIFLDLGILLKTLQLFFKK